MKFYELVQDQVLNLGGGELPFWAPRLEGWLAVCEIHGLIGEERRRLIEQAIYLHALISEREKVLGVHKLALEELEDVDG